MKQIRLLLGILLIGIAHSGDLYQHIQSGSVDAYIDSTSYTQSTLPGMGKTFYSIDVSLTTSDSDAISFAIYVKVELADGTLQVINQTVPRDTTYGNFTVMEMRLDQKPLKLVRFAVTRLHQVEPDVLIGI